jgi:hypothetical protein
MAERTVIESMAGAVLSITATLPATYDSAGYEASVMNFTTVGEVETFGSYGVTANVAEFTPIDTSIITKVKGSKNYGNMDITMACLPSNTGQDLIEAASESKNRYSLKIVFPDTSIHYMDILVSKFEWVGGSANDVRKVNASFAICRKPVQVAQL